MTSQCSMKSYCFICYYLQRESFLVVTFCYCFYYNQMDEMLELFSVMKEEKIPLTVEIFNIIISAHSKRGKMRRAFKLYNDVSWFCCLFPF